MAESEFLGFYLDGPVFGAGHVGKKDFYGCTYHKRLSESDSSNGFRLSAPRSLARGRLL